MVKSITSVIIVALIIFGACLFERFFVGKQFEEFNAVIETLYLKIDDKSANEEDVKVAQTLWLSKKKSLHIFVPHNDIREIDLWITETITLVGDEKWEDALSKVEVLRELSTEVPKYFNLSINNIF